MTCSDCAHCYRPVVFLTPGGLPVCSLRYRANGASSPKNLVNPKSLACAKFELKEPQDPQQDMFKR